MNYCIINGVKYNVRVLELEENWNVLYSENTGRVIGSGAMILDPIGTFIGHTVTFARKGNDRQSFDNLYHYLRLPRTQGLNVEFADGQASIAYKAYVSSGKRKAARIDENAGNIYWDSFQANFIPMEAQVLP